MKKMMFIFVMLVMVAMSANAQVILEQRYENGAAVAYLDNGERVYMSDLPAARYRNNESIQQGIARTYREDAAAYAARFRRSAGYGVGMYGAYPIYGGEGSSFYIGNENWGFGTGSSEIGGYKTSGTNLHIGSFQIGSTKSGYTQPTTGYTRGTSYEAAPTASQKKAAAKAAAKRYSQMKAAGVTNNGTNSNVTTSTGASVLLY